jgi:sugar phosphate isomerase/epimerase
MERLYSLSYLTIEASPPDMIGIAAQAGYDFAGVRMMPAFPGGAAFPLMHDAAMLSETLRRIETTGVRVLDVEIARIDGHTKVETWLPMLEAAARIGARTVIAAGDDPDEARMTATFAALCEAAADFGLTVNLEFTPWAALSDARAATRVVEAAGKANGEILIDTIHAARSTTTLRDIAAIAPERMSYFQICDAPAGTPASREELLHTARQERLLPGEGGVDIAGMVAALPRALIVSVEVPSHGRMARMGAVAWARQTLDVSREAMRALDAGRDALALAPHA